MHQTQINYNNMKQFLVEESEKNTILTMHKNLFEQTQTNKPMTEEETLRKAISVGCLKNGGLKRSKSTGKLYYKKESTKLVGKMIKFFPDMTYEFEDGSKKGKWSCPQIATAVAAEITTNADNTSKVATLKTQGWKTKNELVGVDLNTIDSVYDKKTIGDVILYKLKVDVGDLTPSSSTADFNVKQNAFLDEFKAKGYELNPDLTKRDNMVAVTAKELGAPDSLFPNGLTLYYNPNNQSSIKRQDTSVLGDVLANQSINRQACRKNVDDYFNAFKRKYSVVVDNSTIYKAKRIVQACKDEHYGKWGIAGGGNKLDNYLDILSGVKEGGPSSYGDDSMWRLK